MEINLKISISDELANKLHEALNKDNKIGTVQKRVLDTVTYELWEDSSFILNDCSWKSNPIDFSVESNINVALIKDKCPGMGCVRKNDLEPGEKLCAKCSETDGAPYCGDCGGSCDLNVMMDEGYLRRKTIFIRR